MNMQRKLSATFLAVCLATSGCHPVDSDDADDAGAKLEETVAGGPLAAEQIEAIGITTAPAKAARSAAEVAGFAVVIAHDTIQQAMAEMQTASAALRQSRAAADRINQLAGTPGAMSADASEAAARQVAADSIAVEVARQHLISMLGDRPSWRGFDDLAPVEALARGEQRLVRVTFPLASLGSRSPDSVRIARLDSAQGGRRWKSDELWRAPADANVPGTSFFAILASRDLQEGERLLAWTSVGAQEPGVVIPAAAAVTSAGRFYCFVERGPGDYQRVEFDPGHAMDEGYFVTQGIAEGDPIVITGAAHLLAREINPSTEADE